jgi:hypothetical protein
MGKLGKKLGKKTLLFTQLFFRVEIFPSFFSAHSFFPSFFAGFAVLWFLENRIRLKMWLG